MEITARVLMLILLTLLQVTTFPINLDLLFGSPKFICCRFSIRQLDCSVAFLVSVFGNINFGVVLIALRSRCW